MSEVHGDPFAVADGVRSDEHVARVFAHHWPDAPNLGDIATIDWDDVHTVDVLCGGVPRQDVSTVGTRDGLAPGTPMRALVTHDRSDRHAAAATPLQPSLG
ncbi:MAG: DNA cytosine methyltransferase [Austwickia sp.]|nr:MAG: DNA cytosine methyltransferase [Austwickia sp.]